jgi:hypothetical protein
LDPTLDEKERNDPTNLKRWVLVDLGKKTAKPITKAKEDTIADKKVVETGLDKTYECDPRFNNRQC